MKVFQATNPSSEGSLWQRIKRLVMLVLTALLGYEGWAASDQQSSILFDRSAEAEAIAGAKASNLVSVRFVVRQFYKTKQGHVLISNRPDYMAANAQTVVIPRPLAERESIDETVVNRRMEITGYLAPYRGRTQIVALGISVR